jgi:prepilin-type processing-associated H-X9-DG protein
VVVLLIAVLAAIAFPIIETPKGRVKRAAALTRIKDLGAAALAYAVANNDELPQEGPNGAESWSAAADPENANAWYNAIPKLMGRRNAQDYLASHRQYYTKDNVLYFPAATYPKDAWGWGRPLFAMGINSKLQQIDPDTGKKPPLKRSQIEHQSRTPLFLERGLPGEAKGNGALDEQRKANYDGSPIADAKAFVGRYSGKGYVIFVDGHVEEFAPEDLLTPSGDIPYPPNLNKGELVWRRTLKEDPNK